MIADIEGWLYEWARDRKGADRIRTKAAVQKVSESFDNSADESLNYVNFPRNWRKMGVEHKQELARLISENAKEDVAKTLNVSVRTVENWIVSLTSEGYLQ